MTTDKLNRFWLLAIALLIVIIVASSTVIWFRRDSGQPIAISPPQAPQFTGEIYLDGAIANPGIYPLKATDNINSIIQASGGIEKNADLSQVHLHIPRSGEGSQPQKIDINRADAWLLQALPNIGEIRAQAIVNYRQQNGPFRHIEDVTQVTGISSAIFEKIKDYITVAE